MSRNRRCCAVVIVLGIFAAIAAAPAMASPVWRLDVHHNPTNFAPGGGGALWFELANVGDEPIVGPISLTIGLHGGLGFASSRVAGSPAWSCPALPGQTSIVCTTNGVVARHSLLRNLIVDAKLDPGAGGDAAVSARIEGGGADAATASEAISGDPEPAPFGIVPGSFFADAFAADGLTPVRQAGAHPEQVIIGFDLNSRVTEPTPRSKQLSASGNIRHFRLDLPPGFVGNANAVAECSTAQLAIGECPGSSQVGRVDVAFGPLPPTGFPEAFSLPVFNMRNPRGVLADLAFAIRGFPFHLRLSLDPANGYAIVASASDINETRSLFDVRMTLWGVPADGSHDSERCGLHDTSVDCPALDLDPEPFLTMPSRCDVDQAMTLGDYDAWRGGGVFGPDIVFALGQLRDCETLRFEPELDVAPTTARANSPTGLEVEVTVPQYQSRNARASPPVKDVTIALPQGVRISPSGAEGLSACAPAQIVLGTGEPVTCPDASRIGEASLITPLLPEPLEGFLFLAAPHDNPSGGLFAFYLVLRDTEDRGVLLKLPGRLDLDPTSGQITVGFDDLPQLPFERLSLRFRSGSRALLISAPSCGSQPTSALISSYAQPGRPVALTDAYLVSEGPGGGACMSASDRPFAPHLTAGTVRPIAGGSSPLVFRLRRSDGEQELAGISASLPLGLSAGIAGVPSCSEQAIASISTAEGSGRRQLADPSCPGASRMGVATVAVGAGPEPMYLTGPIYLAGPDRGAPISLLVVVPAVAGPFDLGTLTSRVAVFVEPETAQLRLASEPLPRIVAGVPIDVRGLRFDLDRPGLIRNPTNCEEMAIDGTAISRQGVAARLSERFQVGDCASLGLRPRFRVRFGGAAGRNGHPTLNAVLRPRVGDANARRATIALPRGQLLDQTHIDGVCTAARFAAGNCPRSSIYGWAKAWTPLLDRPLVGRVYLRASRDRLPSVAADLRGQIRLVVAGRVDASGGALRLNFEKLPDIPLSRFNLVMEGGRRGLLVNSEDICRRRAQHVRVALRGHNGKVRQLRPRLTAQC